MTKNIQNTADVLGTEAEVQNMEKLSKLSTEQVKEWVKRDLSSAIGLLMAIQTDPDLLNQIVVFMQGRLSNQINKLKNGSV